MDATTGIGGAYPLAKKDRITASEFAKRLKEAEEMQRDEDERKDARRARRAAREKEKEGEVKA